MRVLLVTDSPDLGQALTLFLGERHIVVLDILEDAAAAAAQTASRRPDAVLVDWRLGEAESTRMVADLMGCDDPTPVILLTSTHERARARTTGAAACATLGDPPDALLAALLEVSEGGGSASGRAAL
jgi:DNA-binding response OmpR family regulator